MKIEKISDTQIRCTLTKEDLTNRHLRISELAYGSEKAKALFRDMMQQASNEFNFEADDIPLMIEAIPVSADCLVLVVTKVTDPDELDTRFSNFTASTQPAEEEHEETEENAYADEIINCFEHLSELLGGPLAAKALGTSGKTVADKDADGQTKVSVTGTIAKVYAFDTLAEVTELAHIIAKFYHGENTLYKDTAASVYYLIVNISEHTAEQFNKVCNIISEYGRTVKIAYAGINYFEEHFEVIVRNKAIQVMSKM